MHQNLKCRDLVLTSSYSPAALHYDLNRNVFTPFFLQFCTPNTYNCIMYMIYIIQFNTDTICMVHLNFEGTQTLTLNPKTS